MSNDSHASLLRVLTLHPEVQFVQQRIRCVVTPNDADIEHVQVVVRLQVHAAVAVMVAVGHDHSMQVVVVLRLDQVFNIAVHRPEGFLGCRRLHRFGGQGGEQFNIARQVVPVPKGNQRPHETCNYQYVENLHCNPSPGWGLRIEVYGFPGLV